MPLPHLFKRLSEKSLKKRNRTQSSSSSSADAPPMPRTAASEKSFGEVISGGSTRSLTLNGHSVEQQLPPLPPLPLNGYMLPSGPPPPPAIELDIPQDELSISLQAAWKSANTDPKQSKADKLLQKAENGITGAMAAQAKGVVVVTAVKAGLNAVGGLEGIEKGINALMEGMPVLMSALDELTKLHPFVGVAVMAFKAVWALEMKRRQNDQKILALHVEMKDMMGVLTQLKSVKDADAVAPDGSTIKGRMQIIIENTAKDIKACANACDAYVKKKLVVKVLKGPIWEGKLAAFAGTFTKRRSEFEFAMSIHTALGVDAANRAISLVDETTQAMNQKMDLMMKMFSQMISPEQKEMSRLIDQKGGPSCVDNERVLKELNDFENKSSSAQRAVGSKLGAKSGDLDDLKDDLHANPDQAIEANMEQFSRKFAIQQRQILDEISRVVERQGDRIIGAVLAGPGDRIVDPNIHAVWKEMGWKGSVKTRHFVMALRDHFQEDHKNQNTLNLPQRVAEETEDGKPKSEVVPPLAQEDEWTLEFINVVRLQAISEAFDDDASGFVTIAEVNAFTTARPLDWSLARWIAYWSVGHHQAMQEYANKINGLIGKLFAILPRILPANKSAADEYLTTVYWGVHTIVRSLSYAFINPGLQEKFKSYVASEEERIKGNLEAVKYDIDASDTLELVTGEGRIERYALPMIYLLLEKHLEIFRVCQTRVVHADELWDAADTVSWVLGAVATRLELLRSIFKQQKLDLTQQFKSFSFGMYEYLNEPDLLWAAKIVQETEFVDYSYEESVESPLPELEKILNYPMDMDELDYAAYALSPPSAKVNDATVTHILPALTQLLSSRWHGFLFQPATARYPSAGMVSMTLVPTFVDGQVQHFTASERANKAEFELVGECHVQDDKISITFKRTFSARFSTQFYNGIWNTETNTLSGTLGFEEDVSTHFGAFSFKQLEPEYVCYMPAPVDLEPPANDGGDPLGENAKARALWSFAISSVLFQVRRDHWSWSLFKERRDNRKRFIELQIRSGQASHAFGKELGSAEWDELSKLKKSFTTNDSRFYHSLAEMQIRATTNHNSSCDSCGGAIGGARLSCLVCQMKDSWNTVDFDDSPACMAGRVNRDDMQKPHYPHHDLIKLRRVLHIREFGKAFRNAKAALEKARGIFKAAGIETNDSGDGDDEEQPSEAPTAQIHSLITQLSITIPNAPTAGAPLSAVSVAKSRAEPLPKGPKCANCSKALTMPCWFCVQCTEETFICWECDAKGESGISSLLEKNEHTHNFFAHDLVRVQEAVEDKDLTMEERIGALEDVFKAHEQTVGDRLTRMEKTVEERMARVEMLLEKLVANYKETTLVVYRSSLCAYMEHLIREVQVQYANGYIKVNSSKVK
ncbi:VPS13 domain-containing protein [Mycena indigotica]|uniref:VPS13 domain-containing protein n=1 Tax=Mycena indigotica TaxID=2126181 RepID=A0A8H6S458_9AGAR|nr:VPS13 domain-containing protein [Mycena indigotica]KAF7292835.1 VPS13 domain-containing protein [Mycena indigotica]